MDTPPGSDYGSPAGAGNNPNNGGGLADEDEDWDDIGI
jgi:hypothetical protein